MVRMWSWTLILLVLFSFSFSKASFAADDHAASAGTPASATAATSATSDRATSDLALKDYVVEFLWKAFPKLTKAQLKTRLDKPLPPAMRDEANNDPDGKSFKCDSDKLIDLMIPLLGTYNDQSEVADLLKTIDAADKEDADRFPADKDYVVLRKRLRWAAGVMQGKPNEQFPDFNKCFDGKFDTYQKKQDEFWAKVNDAANGSGETQKAGLDYVAKNTDPSELKTFLDKLTPQANSSSDDKLKKWAANLTKAAPEVEKTTSSPLVKPGTAATGGTAASTSGGANNSGGGAGGNSANTPAAAAPSAAALQQRFFDAVAAGATGKCTTCHSNLKITGGPGWQDFKIEGTLKDGNRPVSANFAAVLSNEKSMGTSFSPQVKALLQNWSNMK